MIEVKDLTKKEVKEIYKIVKLKSTIKRHEAVAMHNWLVKLVDNKYNICPNYNCPAQLRFAHTRLKNFVEKHKDEFEAVINTTDYIESSQKPENKQDTKNEKTETLNKKVEEVETKNVEDENLNNVSGEVKTDLGKPKKRVRRTKKQIEEDRK